MSDDPSPACRSVLHHVALLAGVLVAMLAWTWLKWPDPLIDFGRELYLAGQVASGAALYRDVEHFNGPLSVHFNALLFALFGSSIRTLVLANLGILIAIVGLSWRLLYRAGGTQAATWACLTLLTLFACVQFVEVGNYNYLTPYSHELTHGLLLALAGMWLTAEFARTGRPILPPAIGVVLGLLWLTKLEVFLAGAGATLVGLMLCEGPIPRVRRAALVIGAGSAVVGLAWGLLTLSVGISTASRGILGGAYYALDTRLTSMPFYRSIAGWDNPVANARAMLASAAGMAGLIGLRWVLLRPIGNLPAGPAWLYAVIFPAAAFAVGRHFPWHLAFRGLPLIVAVALVFAVRRAWLRPTCSNLCWAMWLTLSLLLMAKMLLAVQVGHYGFVLAMPATLAVVALLTSPTLLGPANGLPAGGRSRATALGGSVILTIILLHLEFYHRVFATKPLWIGTGANAFRVSDGQSGSDPRGRALKLLLEQLDLIVPRDATLSAVPEGAMINFLTARRNPTPFVTLLPPEFVMFGGHKILRSYQQNPPDFVVVVPTDVGQFGSQGFARDYAAELADWIDRNYVELPTSALPGYRMVLLRRISHPEGSDHPTTSVAPGP
ncbi:MAG: hypothetical protein NZ561_09565 [Phycisphaerae bacterium]|nr:hypothetical protein [Phycisphaerae bacterium]MDW8261441.1 hypothetical protein [Phycisphaerales bacterium]